MSALERADLETRSGAALSDDFLRAAVRFTVERLTAAKATSTDALGAWEEWREAGRAVRAHTLEHLDYYLQQFAERAEAGGARVHFAADTREAQSLLLGIAREAGARRVVKSKSMLSEELGINERLEHAGMHVVETDLGEWIVQLAHETPSHIILPAIHKPRAQIQALFENDAEHPLAPDTKTLAGYARRRLRGEFERADLGISGCNFAVAETGSVVLFTNEGNGRMVTTLPETHVVLMGMERIIPTWDDLELMANLLPRSATGQKSTTYVNVLTGPRRKNEADGPGALHVIVVDNGRSRVLGDPEFRDVLSCIRCGACLNVCPVYRHIGGHAYGSVYSGPIGAVLTPLLDPSPRAAELANASTLCGACFDACPVKIPLHDRLVQLRRRNVERGLPPRLERIAFKLYAKLFSSARLFGVTLRILRFLQRTFIGDGRRVRRAWPLRGWAEHRALPIAPKQAYRQRKREGEA
jgi:L-lactate dehydrogenase complex protein LldF